MNQCPRRWNLEEEGGKGRWEEQCSTWWGLQVRHTRRGAAWGPVSALCMEGSWRVLGTAGWGAGSLLGAPWGPGAPCVGGGSRQVVGLLSRMFNFTL